MRSKPNRWIKRPKGRALIHDSCKPRYSLKSNWYRRPSWKLLFKRNAADFYQIDEAYADWYNSQRSGSLSVKLLARMQHGAIRKSVFRMASEAWPNYRRVYVDGVQ